MLGKVELDQLIAAIPKNESKWVKFEFDLRKTYQKTCFLVWIDVAGISAYAYEVA